MFSLGSRVLSVGIQRMYRLACGVMFSSVVRAPPVHLFLMSIVAMAESVLPVGGTCSYQQEMTVACNFYQHRLYYEKERRSIGDEARLTPCADSF